MKCTFHLLQQFGDIVQRQAGFQIAQVPGMYPQRIAFRRDPPELSRRGAMAPAADSPSPSRAADWAGAVVAPPASATDDPANAGVRREPELPKHEEIAPEPAKTVREFEPPDEAANWSTSAW